MAKRARANCPTACTQAQQRAIVAQVRKSLAKCGPKKRKRAKKAPGRARSSTSTLAGLAETVRAHGEFFARQREVNSAFAGAIAAIYRSGVVPSKPRAAFTVVEAKSAARAIGAPARGVPLRQLAAGMTAELEHGRRAGPLDVTHDDPLASARIALAHLREDRRYYPHLAAMERANQPAAVALVVRELPAPASAPRGRKLATPRQYDGARAAMALASRLEDSSTRVHFWDLSHAEEVTRREMKFAADHELARLVEAYAHRIELDETAQELARTAKANLHDREPTHPKPRKARGARVNVEAVEETVEALESDPLAIPQPIGPEGYRPPRCATHHEPWNGEYENALEEARERAAIEAGDDEERYRVLLRAYFAEHPRFADWSQVERECVADFRSKHARRTRHTVTASDETRAAIREASAELGYDVTGSAEHLDRLSLGGQAAYWRRLHKRTGSVDALRRAREIETRMRARRKKGAGVATFAVG